MNTPDRSSARKQRRDHNSPYSRKASKPKASLDPLPTLASSSSFRNLYNFVSSPFRSRAAPPPPQAESDEEEDDEEEEGDETQPIELGDSDEDMDQHQEATSSWKGKGRGVEGNSTGGLTRSSASTNLSSLPPLPNPNSSKWISALAPSSTHAHALLQMAPSSQVSQPRYAKQPMAPPPPPPSRGIAGMSRSQTLSSLQPGASSTSNSSSTSTRAELILERFLAEKGLSEEDEREVRDLMVKKGRDSEAIPPPPSIHSTTYTPPLFHPGTSATRLAASTSTNTLANSRLARSTSTMSFLSPSRSSSSQLSSSSSSRQLNARASSPGAFASPGKRRPIYLGPGVSHSPSRAKRNVTFGGLDLKPSVVVQSPGKKRRVDDDRDDEDMDVERELSGLGGSSSSSGRGLTSSQSVPSFLTSAPESPSSPFTFSVPSSPSTSTSQPTALSPSPARALAPPPAPAPKVIKPSQSLSSGLSRYSRNPSLVAPSPLRQSTSFAESPESVKSNGGSPAGSPLGAKGAGNGNGASRSKASSMMLDFIQEEEVAKRVASPTPIQNPYQSAGLASPSPRRNPRRSVAAESRSSRAGTPRKGANGDGLKVPTALELIEREGQKESMNSPTPTSKKQKSLSSNSNSNEFSLDGPSTPSRASASSAPLNETSTTPTSAPPSKRKAPVEDAPPSWMTDVQPPTVIFAHDAFGGPIFGSKKSITSFGGTETFNQDSDMDESTSPAKLFTSSVDSREKIEEKDFGKKPSFAFDTTITSISSSSSSKKSTSLPFESPSFKSTNPTSSKSKSSDPKTIALETDRLLLPNFTFIFSSITTPLPTSALESQAISEVTKLPSSSLPKFDLLASPPPPPPPASTSTGGFNWASAGLAPPPKPSADIWTCGTCGTKSPLEKEKCIACEEPRPAQKKTSSASSSSKAPTPVAGSFNWASAGMAPPPKPSSDIWTCDVCGTKSPLDKAKCIACEEPRPPVSKPTPSSSSSSSAPPPPPVVSSGGFNWAASGFAPPPAPSSDVWICGDCGTKSPKEKEKCIACEAPNPTKKAATASAAAVGGFNWGAAGMKVPEKKAGWECGVCMIRNGEERTKCASCETERS